MNQRKAKAARRAPPKSIENGHSPDSPVLEAPPEPQATEPQSMTHPAVVVMRVATGEPGQERVEMMELNGLDPLAVPTLLRVAATIKENSLGLGERK